MELAMFVVELGFEVVLAIGTAAMMIAVKRWME